MIRLRLLRKWGEYGAGSVADFGESKGKPLIAAGVAEKVSSKEKIRVIKDRGETIRLKLLKTWGPYGIGSIVDFGESKGRPLIESGVAVQVAKKEKKVTVNPSKKKAGVETATAKPDAETADNPPDIPTGVIDPPPSAKKNAKKKGG
jgi:hypothetical protein